MFDWLPARVKKREDAPLSLRIGFFSAIFFLLLFIDRRPIFNFFNLRLG
jgi:hypothetical protein